MTQRTTTTTMRTFPLRNDDNEKIRTRLSLCIGGGRMGLEELQTRRLIQVQHMYKVDAALLRCFGLGGLAGPTTRWCVRVVGRDGDRTVLFFKEGAVFSPKFSLQKILNEYCTGAVVQQKCIVHERTNKLSCEIHYTTTLTHGCNFYVCMHGHWIVYVSCRRQVFVSANETQFLTVYIRARILIFESFVHSGWILCIVAVQFCGCLKCHLHCNS